MTDFLQQDSNVTQAIQLILAPAVMISACGLLTLGISSKFSTVLNRIRLLNEEKRKLFVKAGDAKKFTLEENQRLASITRQLQRLIERARYVRNSLVSYFIAIALFISTSLLIGLQFFFRDIQVRWLIIDIFLLGMVMVFCGVVFAVRDTFKGFDIVKFEVEAED
ncbi:MAG: DUF2721 domain-containing protein [Ignavibacteriales bacterium]|nr:DUF2721 domain-containing protein [Ignavibacteriales bacterium]